VIERRDVPPPERQRRPRSADQVRDLIAARIKATDGRISAKRLLPLVRAEGYAGSARTLRRAVHEAGAEHRRERRTYRPWQPVPGGHLVIDWGELDGLHVFCAVLAWSRVRFVRFAARQDQPTTLRLLAECFEALGGVPAVVLADRMGCPRGGLVANVVVPAPGYVAFARHYGFRPDFCEAAAPESLHENIDDAPPRWQAGQTQPSAVGRPSRASTRRADQHAKSTACSIRPTVHELSTRSVWDAWRRERPGGTPWAAVTLLGDDPSTTTLVTYRTSPPSATFAAVGPRQAATFWRGHGGTLSDVVTRTETPRDRGNRVSGRALESICAQVAARTARPGSR